MNIIRNSLTITWNVFGSSLIPIAVVRGWACAKQTTAGLPMRNSCGHGNSGVPSYSYYPLSDSDRGHISSWRNKIGGTTKEKKSPIKLLCQYNYVIKHKLKIFEKQRQVPSCQSRFGLDTSNQKNTVRPTKVMPYIQKIYCILMALSSHFIDSQACDIYTALKLNKLEFTK